MKLNTRYVGITGCTRISLVAVLTVFVTVIASVQPTHAANELRFGAFAGAGLLNLDANEVSGGVTTDIGGVGASVIYGATFGYDWRTHHGNFYGLEMDVSLGDITHTEGDAHIEMDYLFTIRARYGAPIGYGWDGYMTAGFAWLGLENTDRTPNPMSTLKTSETLFGGVIGFGAERSMHGMVLFGEYLYAGFGEWKHTRDNRSYDISAGIHSVRAGIKLKIGYDHDYRDPYEEHYK